MFPIRNRSRWVGYLKKATRAVDGDADYLTYQVVIPWMPTQDPIKLGGIIGAKMVVQEDQDSASSFKVSVALTLSEALFLQGRGVLKVLLDETVEPPSLGTSFPLGSSSQSSSRESELCCCELWRIGMNSAEHGGGEAFGIITAAEMYFRKKGFLVGPGLLFGGHLTLYRRPRAAAHSSFVVRVVRARAAAAAAAATAACAWWWCAEGRCAEAGQEGWYLGGILEGAGAGLGTVSWSSTASSEIFWELDSSLKGIFEQPEEGTASGCDCRLVFPAGWDCRLLFPEGNGRLSPPILSMPRSFCCVF